MHAHLVLLAQTQPARLYVQGLPGQQLLQDNSRHCLACLAEYQEAPGSCIPRLFSGHKHPALFAQLPCTHCSLTHRCSHAPSWYIQNTQKASRTSRTPKRHNTACCVAVCFTTRCGHHRQQQAPCFAWLSFLCHQQHPAAQTLPALTCTC